jgi:Flp pilus assembly protein TadG
MKRANHSRRLLRRFAGDSGGSIALIMGLSMVPVTVCAGAAIDYARAMNQRQVFSSAVDSAALAVASSPLANLANVPAAQKTKQIAKLKEVARDYLKHNYQANIAGSEAMSVTVNIGDNGVIHVKASHKFPASLMRIVGINQFDIGAEAEVNTKDGAVNGIEIAMVMDTTGSMAGTKIADAKAAAHDLTDILFGGKTTNNNVRVALVPFSGAVNVGSQYRNSGWIDVNGASSVAHYNFTDPTWHNMRAWDNLANARWNGCVEARPGAMATDDTPPTSGNSLFVPYFAPDEPSISGYNYYNTYIGATPETAGISTSTTFSNHLPRQMNQAKYVGRTISLSSQYGPWFNCATAPIVPLTSDRTTIDNGVNAMSAAGSTVIPEGLAWGWRVLSPTAPFTEGSPYHDKFWKKVVVLMTDGENDLLSGGNEVNTLNGTWYSAYGFGKQGRLGTTNSYAVNGALDARLQTVCDNVKAQGVTVYTISFQVTAPAIRDLLRNCATDPEKYLEAATGSILRQHFQAIGDQLRSIYLSK